MVQQFREREVQQSGQVPGYQNVTYSPDAFGAQAARALQGLGETTANIGQMVAQVDAEKKTNDVLNTVEKARDELRPALFDPDKGIYAQSGGNALGSGEKINAKLDEIQKKYIDSETDPQKQQLLRKMWSKEKEQNKDSVARFELGESGKYKAETSKAVMFGAMEDAYNSYNDDKIVDGAIERSVAAIEVNAQGLPAEALKLMKEEATSNIRLAAISRWTAENPKKALDYYKAHKDDLSGKDHVVASQLLKVAQRKDDVAYATARIIGGGDPTLFNRMENAESTGNTNAESPKGAAGIMQIIPDTARQMLIQTGRSDLAKLSDAELKNELKNNTGLNRELGQRYMNQQLNAFGGDTEAALVAYNAGPEAAKAFLAHNAGNPPGQRDYNVPGWKGIKTESEAYVKKILGGTTARETPAGQRMTAANWSLKNFKAEDLTAPTEGGAWVDARAAQGLDDLATVMKEKYGVSVKVNEERSANGETAGRRRGTSDPKDNPHVKKSQHLHGRAFDVQTQGWSDEQKAAFLQEARSKGFAGVGFYGPGGHLHIDMGPQRTWGRIPSWAREIMNSPMNNSSVGNAANPTGEQSQTQQVANGAVGASDQSGYFIDTRKTALAEWMAQAETIDDPDVRAGTIAQLKVQAAVMDHAKDAENNAAKQTAWEDVINGKSVKDFTPDILARLDPSFVSTLAGFEEARAKGGVKTDWAAYSKAGNLSEEELVTTDVYTDYRNKLGDAEFKELVNRKTEAQKKLAGQDHDAALLANGRSRSEIVKDIARTQGWKDDNPAISEFQKQFSIRIQGEQAIKKDKLTDTEMQDIADKMLIEDKVSSVWSSTVKDFWSGKTSQGQAMNAQAPDEFVAASTWEDVQPDDQKVVIERYEALRGDTPDADQATDIYNRAMRVWLGGKPDGPDDEKQALRDKITSMRGEVTDKYFEAFYGQYLLSYLGR